MAYCKNCGAYIPDGQTKCLACGVDEAEQTAQAAQTRQTKKKSSPTSAEMREQLERQREKQRENSRKWAEAESARRAQSGETERSVEEDDYSSSNEHSSKDNSKLFAILSYLGILWILPYIFSRDDEFAMYHAKQGLTLCIVAAVCRAVGGLLSVGWLVTLAWAYMVFTGIGNANAGRMKPLPYIGKLLMKK